MSKAEREELIIYLKNRPISFFIIEAVGRIGEVVNIPGIGYFVNDPDIGKMILRDPEHFNSHDIGSVGYLITQVLGDFALVNMDGAEHELWKTKLRGLFTSKYIEEVYELAIKDYLSSIKTKLKNGEIVDIAQVAEIVAGRMSAGMVGANLKNNDEAQEIFAITNEFTAFAGLGKMKLPEEQVKEAQKLTDKIAVFAERSYNDENRDGSVTQRLKEMGLPFDQVKGLLTTILVGGSELIAHAIPRIIALLINSNQIDLLRSDPSLMTKTVEEGLRFMTPSSIVLRAVAHDTKIGKYTFKKGRRALIVNYNMLKSKKYFVNPRKFDITRTIDSSVKHSWFGGGPHFCLGFSLAHKEIISVLEMLIDIPGEFEIIKRSHYTNKVFPGFKSLQIKVKK